MKGLVCRTERSSSFSLYRQESQREEIPGGAKCSTPATPESSKTWWASPKGSPSVSTTEYREGRLCLCGFVWRMLMLNQCRPRGGRQQVPPAPCPPVLAQHWMELIRQGQERGHPGEGTPRRRGKPSPCSIRGSFSGRCATDIPI